MNFSQPQSYMYVKNEFNKCKDSESRAQWEKTGVHVFPIAEAPPVLWKDSESRAQWGKTGVHVFPIAEAQRTEAESKSDGRAKGILCFGN